MEALSDAFEVSLLERTGELGLNRIHELEHGAQQLPAARREADDDDARVVGGRCPLDVAATLDLPDQLPGRLS